VNNLVVIKHPQGGGGNWLLYLIARLYFGKTYIQQHNNFHNQGDNNNINGYGFTLIHREIDLYDYLRSLPSGIEYNNIYRINYFTDKVFMLFFNKLKKVYFGDKKIIDGFYEDRQLPDFGDGSNKELYQVMIKFFSEEALYLIRNPYDDVPDIDVDIDYSLIFTDRYKFVEQVKESLNRIGIHINYDIEIINECIDEYIISCQNLNEVFGKYENVFWIAWSIAIIDQLDIVVDINLLETTDFILVSKEVKKYSNQIEEYTNEYHMFK